MMMKNFVLLIVYISIWSCMPKLPSYIHGHIYSYKYHKPLKGIKIEDPYNMHINTYTDANGYFRINELTKGEYLYVKKDNKKIDSIYYIRTHPERGEKYYFVEGRKDTLFIKINE